VHVADDIILYKRCVCVCVRARTRVLYSTIYRRYMITGGGSYSVHVADEGGAVTHAAAPLADQDPPVAAPEPACTQTRRWRHENGEAWVRTDSDR
jgi:hypothetical protein